MLLSDHWHIPAPRLIVSVTGGAIRFYLKSRLKASFKRGLVNVATSTGECPIPPGLVPYIYVRRPGESLFCVVVVRVCQEPGSSLEAPAQE